jgi:tetratricopeptide (TPR) repeat protein
MKPNQIVALLLLFPVLLFPAIVSAQPGQEADDFFKQGQGLYNRAQNRAEVGKALKMFEKALVINSKLGPIQQQGWNLNDIGLVYRSWGEYPKALDYFDKARELFRGAGTLKEEAITLNNVADLRAQSGAYDKTLSDRQRALEIQKKIGVPAEWTLDEIGNLYLDMGKTALAESVIKEAGYLSSLGRLALIKADYGNPRQCYEKLVEWGKKLAEGIRSSSVARVRGRLVRA